VSEQEVLAVLIARARALGIADDETSMKRMREAANKAAIELRSCKRTEVNLPFLGAGPEGPIHLLAQLPAPVPTDLAPVGPLLDPRVKLS
jgi:hypothetical protein